MSIKAKRTFRFTMRFNRYWYAVGLIALVILAGAVRDFAGSLFFHRQDRLNVVIYGDQTHYYSFGLNDTVNYDIALYPDLKVQVPGGYGYYRIGGLGKLVQLEHKPYILGRTFSYATASFADYYFYPASDTIYYGGPSAVSERLPGIRELFSLSSNAGFFDRVYLFLLFSKKRPEDYKPVREIPTIAKGGDRYLDPAAFSQELSGFFYNNTFRTEKKNIQILYEHGYGTAEVVSAILEGNGIRVSDLTQEDGSGGECIVRESGPPFSETAKELSGFFGCRLEHGQTDIYDIVLVLHGKEKEWESSHLDPGA